MDQFLLPGCAHTARHALAARFVSEKGGNAREDIPQINSFIEHHDNTGSQGGSNRPGSFESQRHIQLLGPDKCASSAP